MGYSARGGLESVSLGLVRILKTIEVAFIGNLTEVIMQLTMRCIYRKAKSYEPNGYNLYNMAGNVAEWTNSSYDQTLMNTFHQ
jgi:hypothetical protein